MRFLLCLPVFHMYTYIDELDYWNILFVCTHFHVHADEASKRGELQVNLFSKSQPLQVDVNSFDRVDSWVEDNSIKPSILILSMSVRCFLFFAVAFENSTGRRHAWGDWGTKDLQRKCLWGGLFTTWSCGD
jgi:hypothetical protein